MYCPACGSTCLWAEAFWSSELWRVLVCASLDASSSFSSRWEFHCNWQLARYIRQIDKLECTQWGTELEAFHLCVFPSICLSFSSFSDGLRIGQFLHQVLCVCWSVYVSTGCMACRSIDLRLSLWSMAFVCQIYLSCRLSIHCHSLTHGSDTSESCTGGKITHISDLLNSFFPESPGERML